MQTYIIIAILAYLAFAVNAVIDKFLLHKGIPESLTYAFYIGVMSLSAILLVPFGFAIPQPEIIIIALISGAFFIYALAAFFQSLKLNEASRVLPVMGSFVPIITFFLSFFLVSERLGVKEIAGLGVLVLGTVLISSDSSQKREKRSVVWLLYALLGACLFAFSFTLSKLVYLDQSFISGLVWTRLGAVFGSFTILLIPDARKKIFNTTSRASQSTGFLFLFGQAVGAGAGVLQNFAVALGSVTLVNAMQGVQFVFVLFLTWLLSKWHSQIFQEDFSGLAFIKKISAIILIIIGLILIA